MALPSKKSKININLDPPKVGTDYLEYGMERIEQLMLDSDKKTNYLPKTITFKDIDFNVKDFIENGKVELIIDGKKVPVFYLENERWGEFSKTWKFMDGDKNVPTPYITIRRTDKKEGTRLGKKWSIPQNKSHKYLDVPIMDDGQVINLRFKIPEPTNVDLTYDIKLFSKYRKDINKHDQIIMSAFKSRQEYLWIKGNPMPIIVESVDEENSTVQNIDGDRYYVSTYNFKVQGFIQDEREFEIVKTTRQPKIGIDLDSTQKVTKRRSTPNIDQNIDTISILVRNSDDSYSARTSNDLLLPDITVTDSIGNSYTFPSVIDITLTASTETPVYSYPILSQQTTYEIGDEGWQVANIWNPIYAELSGSSRPTVKLTDFYTLDRNNKFGNRSRFTTTGGTAPPSNYLGVVGNYVLDHYLGIQLTRTSVETATWNDYITQTRAYDDGSWYPVPRTIIELLYDHANGTTDLNNEVNTNFGTIWTSTTVDFSTLNAWRTNFGGLFYDSESKSSSQTCRLAYKPIEDSLYAVTGITASSASTEIQLSYAYPQLTQTQSFRDGDEGWQLANVWNDVYGSLNNRRATIGLRDFYTLEVRNQFGNYSRFTLSGGTPAAMDGTDFFAGDVIYDNYLGLQYINTNTGAFISWDDMITGVTSYDDGSWYPVPRVIFEHLFDNSDVFRNNNVLNFTDTIWTATSYDTNQAYAIANNNSRTLFFDKSTGFFSLGYKLIPTTGSTTYQDTIPRSYAYPMLSQETSFYVGDEGWQLANVWDEIYGTLSERRSIVALEDFYTLETPNQFGNRARFTTTGGTPAAMDNSDFATLGDIIYDNYLGLQLIKSAGSVFDWEGSLDYANSFDDGSWNLPPKIVFDLLWDSETANLKINDVLFLASSNHPTSTTDLNNTADSFYVNMSQNFMSHFGKNNVTYHVNLLYKPLNQSPETDMPSTYAYPFISQKTAYDFGDDGIQRVDFWLNYYNPENPEVARIAELKDFYTLKTPNRFGNYLRFTDASGNDTTMVAVGQTIYDNYLGVEFAYFQNTGVTWSNYLSTARAYDDGSWYPVPLEIMTEIIDNNDPLSRFNNKINLGALLQWTSTTVKDDPTAAFTPNQRDGGVTVTRLKSASTPNGDLAYRLLELPDGRAITGITKQQNDLPSFNYPILSQTISYADGDDGTQITELFGSVYGSFKERRSVIGLTDFYTLESPNQFGTYERFTNPTGGTIIDNDLVPPTTNIWGSNEGDIIYDNYLGLQFILAFSADTLTAITWQQNIDYVRAYDDGSWYPLPADIIQTITDKDLFYDNNVLRFINKKMWLQPRFFWTSTSYWNITTQSWRADIGIPNTWSRFEKTDAQDVTILGYKLIPTTGDTSYTVDDIKVGYSYPILSQTTSYIDYDEGWQLANFWNDLYNFQPIGYQQRLYPDFYTLKYPDPIFNQRTRFTLSGGTPATSADTQNGEVIYDNYLGIQMKLNALSNLASGWNEAVNTNHTNFDDGSWYLPPLSVVMELFDSELDDSGNSNSLNDVLKNLGDSHWIATTVPRLTDQGYRFSSFGVQGSSKTFTGNGIFIMYKPIQS